MIRGRQGLSWAVSGGRPDTERRQGVAEGSRGRDQVRVWAQAGRKRGQWSRIGAEGALYAKLSIWI